MFTDYDMDINPLEHEQKKKHRKNNNTCGVTICAAIESQLLDDEVILDNGSTINIFHNPDLLDGPLKDANLKNVHTYGGKASAV